MTSRTRRTSALLAAAALVGGFAWWFARDTRTETRPVLDEAARSAHTVDAVNATELAESEGPVARAAAENAGPAPEGIALATSDAPSTFPTLTVVRDFDREPVPGAVVYWIESRDPKFVPALRRLGPDHAAGPWPEGTQRFVAD